MEKQGRPLIAGFLTAVGALLLFAWLANQVLHHEIVLFDNSVRGYIHSWASPPLTLFFRGITQTGSEYVLVPLGGVVVWRLLAIGRRHAAILFLLAALGAEALDQILKMLFRRQRPEVFFGFAAPSSYSFPSGHSMVSACFFGVLAAILTVRMPSRGRRAAIWIGCALMALLIGTSRIYLGVHYPSDVLAGYAAAIIWVSSIRAGYEVWLRRRRS